MSQSKEIKVTRKAVMKKNKAFKFGQSLKKGDEVMVEEQCIGKGRYKHIAYGKNSSLGFGITPSEFEYVDKETYVVSVTRISYSTRNIEVKALTREEAKQLAIDEAGNQEFSEQSADYEANSVLTKTQSEILFN